MKKKMIITLITALAVITVLCASALAVTYTSSIDLNYYQGIYYCDGQSHASECIDMIDCTSRIYVDGTLVDVDYDCQYDDINSWATAKTNSILGKKTGTTTHTYVNNGVVSIYDCSLS